MDGFRVGEEDSESDGGCTSYRYSRQAVEASPSPTNFSNFEPSESGLRDRGTCAGTDRSLAIANLSYLVENCTSRIVRV